MFDENPSSSSSLKEREEERGLCYKNFERAAQLEWKC